MAGQAAFRKRSENKVEGQISSTHVKMSKTTYIWTLGGRKRDRDSESESLRGLEERPEKKQTKEAKREWPRDKEWRKRKSTQFKIINVKLCK